MTHLPANGCGRSGSFSPVTGDGTVMTCRLVNTGPATTNRSVGIHPAASVIAVAQTLPSTSTNAPMGPVLMLGFGLIALGVLVLRRQVRHL